jgi:poly(A) polymerase
MGKENISLLRQATEYFRERGQVAYMVGGSLRDLLLGEVGHDWDIVTGRDAHGLARKLADALGGYYARLHEKASRVVVKVGANGGSGETGEAGHSETAVTFDVSPVQGASIEDDLRRRDFTVNALAAPLEAVVRYMERIAEDAGVGESRAGDHEDRPSILDGIIDPLRGVQDIEARRLRVVDAQVFRSDPLRMLRAVRFVARYGMTLDRQTQALILRDAALLPSVAARRIHEELYAILEPEGATAQLRLLDSLGLLTILIPEFMPARGMPQPYPHYWDVLEHSLETVGALERVARRVAGSDGGDSLGDDDGGSMGGERAMNRAPTTDDRTVENRSEWITGDVVEIRNILKEAERQGIFSFGALVAPRMKMAALLHDIGKPATYAAGEDGSIHFYNHPQVGVSLAEQIMRRLSASTQDRRLVQQVVAHHMRPGQLGQDSPVTPRAIRRYFLDLGPNGILVALFSLADHLATFGPRPLTASWERHTAVVRLLLETYVRERERILPPRLLSADELMRRLKLNPGPLVGELLDEIAEAQAEGRIHSREEALWLAEERLHHP